jgi:hypothetical protein
MVETRMKGEAKRAIFSEFLLRDGQQDSFESAAHGHRPKWVGYLTGEIYVDSVLKALALFVSVALKSDSAWDENGQAWVDVGK